MLSRVGVFPDGNTTNSNFGLCAGRRGYAETICTVGASLQWGLRRGPPTLTQLTGPQGPQENHDRTPSHMWHWGEAAMFLTLPHPGSLDISWRARPGPRGAATRKGGLRGLAVAGGGQANGHLHNHRDASKGSMGRCTRGAV